MRPMHRHDRSVRAQRCLRWRRRGSISPRAGVLVIWIGQEADPVPVVAALGALGFAATAVEPGAQAAPTSSAQRARLSSPSGRSQQPTAVPLRRWRSGPHIRWHAPCLPRSRPSWKPSPTRASYGVEGAVAGRRARLGRAAWVADIGNGAPRADGAAFAFAGGAVVEISFRETLRTGTRQAVERHRRSSIAVGRPRGCRRGGRGCRR